MAMDPRRERTPRSSYVLLSLCAVLAGISLFEWRANRELRAQLAAETERQKTHDADVPVREKQVVARAVSDVASACASSDPKEKSAARARVLQDMGSAGTGATFAAFALDGRPFAQDVDGEELSSIDPVDAANAVARELLDEVLGATPEEIADPDTALALLGNVRDDRSQQLDDRLDAAFALRELGEQRMDEETSLDLLRSAWDDGDPRLTLDALDLLEGAVTAAHAPLLAASLEDENEEIRELASVRLHELATAPDGHKSLRSVLGAYASAPLQALTDYVAPSGH